MHGLISLISDNEWGRRLMHYEVVKNKIKKSRHTSHHGYSSLLAQYNGDECVVLVYAA